MAGAMPQNSPTLPMPSTKLVRAFSAGSGRARPPPGPSGPVFWRRCFGTTPLPSRSSLLYTSRFWEAMHGEMLGGGGLHARNQVHHVSAGRRESAAVDRGQLCPHLRQPRGPKIRERVSLTSAGQEVPAGLVAAPEPSLI